MKNLLLLALLISANAWAGDLPNPKLTPGASRVVTKAILCTTSTKLVRHTTASTKKQVYAEYGLKPTLGDNCSGPSHSCFLVSEVV